MSAARPKRQLKMYEPRKVRTCTRCPKTLFGFGKYCYDCQEVVAAEVRARYHQKKRLEKEANGR